MNYLIYSMTLCSLFFTFIMQSHQIITKDNHHADVAVVIMVKDEANVIIPTLQPFIDAGIDSFLVFDTGSTDYTQEIISNHFKHCCIEHGHVLEEPFIDFATSRNHSLDAAEELFPNIEFFLMLDAEWYTPHYHARWHR
jgi:hypothetical protein